MLTIRGEGVSVRDVYEVAVGGRAVALDDEKMRQVAATFDRVQAWGLAKHPIYGVNTGFGELTHLVVPPRCKTQLQENLVRSHAAGAGPAFPDDAVRAMLLARMNCLIRGYSGVSTHALELQRELLNRRIHPLVPQQGSLGASGDLGPLAHLALPLIGEGFVRVDGAVRPSAEVLAEQELKPLQLGFKEALALINGTSAMTGVASLAVVRAFKLLQTALLVSADFVQCMRGSTRDYEAAGHQLRNQRGQVVVARELRKLLQGSSLMRDHRELMRSIFEKTSQAEEVVDTALYLQHAYTLRCIPQILGPVLDTLRFCRGIVENEISSCNDNPLFFEDVEETFHGGNFHGQYVGMISDFLGIAVAEIGVLAERQANRILDPYLNGELPAFLAAGESGLFCGFEGGQYLATSIASENLDIAAPASIKSIPSNGSNQDVVSMGLIAARKTQRLCDHVHTILTVLAAACSQASHFVGPEKFTPPVRALHERLAAVAPLYRDDRPLDQLFGRVGDLLGSDDTWSMLDELIDLED